MSQAYLDGFSVGRQPLGDELVAAYLEGLENAAAQAPKTRLEYAGTLRAAAEAARRLMRD